MGHHYSYRCRNYRWGNLLTVTKTNDELAAADKVKIPKRMEKDSERQRQSNKASTVNRRIHYYRRTSAG